DQALTLQLGHWERSGPYFGNEEQLFESDFLASDKRVEWLEQTQIDDGSVFTFSDIDERSVVYLRRRIQSKSGLTQPLYLGTSNAYQIWLNDEMVYQNEDNDEYAVDQGNYRLNLKKGRNELVVKLVCYDNPPNIFFSLTPPPEGIISTLGEMQQRLYRSVTNDMQKRRVFWEIQDGVWNFVPSEELANQIGERYKTQIDQEYVLSSAVRRLQTIALDVEDLSIIRSIYLLSKFDEQLAYVQTNYEDDNQKWNSYKEEYGKRLSQLSDALEAYANNAVSMESTIQGLVDMIGYCETMPIRLPSTPLEPGPFGAYYTKLKYYPDWDTKWRVSEDADVQVVFPDDKHKFVFWRGTNYIPHWVTEDGFWFNNEFNETWFSEGSAEPMSDKQCRYSHVRVIESNPARTVIHWRYALNDVNYDIAWPDAFTAWGDWSDEYYYIYPDAVGVRKVVLHTSYAKENPTKGTDEAGHEWQEGIVVYHPFTRPEEYLHIDAVHVANMKGESGKWSWEKHGDPMTPTPEGSNIVMMNMKSDYKPFIISPEGCNLSAYRGAQGGSHFRWRDHWPTTTEPTPGRNATGQQAAHGSFFHVLNIPYLEREPEKLTKIMLHGLTKNNVEGLVPIAKSWLEPPVLKLAETTEHVVYEEYNPSERAYILRVEEEADQLIDFDILANSGTPAVNPVIRIDNAQSNNPTLSLNGTALQLDQDFTVGTERGLDHSRLIIWVNKELRDKSSFTLSY
ncbi:MAG: hypothetical protein AAGC88_10615, partial [Bacteroidota bacterium]